MGFAAPDADALTRELETESEPFGLRVDDPAREARELLFEIEAGREELEREPQLRARTPDELLGEQSPVAGRRFPGDVPRGVTRMVLAQPREIVAAARQAGAFRVAGFQRRQRES